MFCVINLSNPTLDMPIICCMLSTSRHEKVGNFHKAVVTFTFSVTLCTHRIADCHYRHGTSSPLEYISGGSDLSSSVHVCIYS